MKTTITPKAAAVQPLKPELDDEPIHCSCPNCDWEGTTAEMKRVYPDIPDLSERMAPGEECPEGECPKCGALCHPIDLPTVDFTVHLRNTIRRMVCMIEEIRTIQSPVNTLVDVQSLGRAALGNNPLPLKVVVEVRGGVAEVTTCPTGVEVEIVDHDNEGR